jgi:hypothetical protein
VASRYLFVYKDWIEQNVGNVIFLEIRDTREHEVFPPTVQDKLRTMIADPAFVIQNKWEPFQSYNQSYFKDMMPALMKKMHFLSMTYIPYEVNKSAALNFHITQREKQDIYQSVMHQQNQATLKQFLQLLNQ